jgi:hypothetical protein
VTGKLFVAYAAMPILIRQTMTRSHNNDEEAMWAIAEQHGMHYVNLGEVVIPPAVIGLVPEAVARESIAIPLAEAHGKLTLQR